MIDFTPMNEKPETPKVGIGVVMYHDGKILLMKRAGSHGAGEWSLPGGHLELGETEFDCAKRELFEETGVSLHGWEKITWGNNIMESDGLHYVTLFVRATEWSGHAEIKEPDKCSEIGWFKTSNLPKPLFGPLVSVLFELGETL